MATSVSTVIVGGGYAGLAASFHLSQAGLEHLILEKGQVGETWRSQRWDSFALNTNNRLSTCPGQTYSGANPEGYALRGELVGAFERFVATHRLPLITGTDVTALERNSRGTGFCLNTSRNGDSELFESRHVIVASGFQNRPVLPAISDSLPENLLQIHAAQYRNPDLLPPGSILVVGSAQSGCQIAEDLLEAGRRVFLSVSSVARIPRRYRGRDIIDWFIDSGFWDVRVQDLEDPKVRFAAQPQVSGVGPLGRTVSLQSLAQQGAILVGRLTGASDAVLGLSEGVAACVQYGDERSAFFKKMVDEYIDRTGIPAAAPEDDPADLPARSSVRTHERARLDVEAEGITSVVWCTGFTGEFSWIHLPVFEKSGRPLHQRGVSRVPGMYFLGAPWLHKRKSGVLYGMSEDAEFIVKQIYEHGPGLAQTRHASRTRAPDNSTSGSRPISDPNAPAFTPKSHA